MTQNSTEQLILDLQRVVADAEELLKATAGQAGDKIATARSRAEQSVQDAKSRLTVAGHKAGEHYRDATREADQYVHENPWTAISVAAGVGLLIGVMLARK